MKVAKAKVAEHRAALIATASSLIRERGFDGAGVADISRLAGLTQGAFYSHFESKSALLAEACRQAFTNGTTAWLNFRAETDDVLSAYLDAYLSCAHVKDVANGCPMAAYVSEVRRQDEAVGQVFVDGFIAMSSLLQDALPDTASSQAARRRALVLMSAMIGSVVVARATAKTDPALSKEIISAARQELMQLARSIGDYLPSSSRPDAPSPRRRRGKLSKAIPD